VTRRAIATVLGAVCLLFALAPVASAQSIGDLTGGVEDVLGGGGDGTSEGSGSDGEPSSPSGDDGLSGAIGGITDILDGDEEDPSQSENPVTQIKNGLEKTFDDTKEEVGEATSDPSGYVGGVPQQVDKTVKDTKRSLKNKTERTREGDANTPTITPNHNGVYDEVRDLGFAAALQRDSREIELASAQAPTNEVVLQASPGVIAEIGRVAAEAAEQVAFPLALALMVGAFLMVQNRIDRRDPKLALAPIDADHETLTFS
jgi:hypothetical protein